MRDNPHAMPSPKPAGNAVPKRQSIGCLQLRPGSSDLTAHPTDLFDEYANWVELGRIPTKVTPAAFWYVIRSFTCDRHWNRTIFDIALTAEETVPLCEENASAEDTKHGGHNQWAPKRGWRYNAVRTLSRKTPAPIGGGDDGTQRTYRAEEWTAQFVSVDEGVQKHHAVFGLVIPQCVRTSGNERALRYWPFQYPKVRCYRFTYEEGAEGAMLTYAVMPLGDDARNPRDFETLKRHSAKTAEKLLTILRKRADSYDSYLGGSTYIKRVVHDNLLTEVEYRQRYDDMKVKYSFWVECWTECTDPVKFVYEELSIAAYLCALWDKERLEEGLSEKQSFIDCGCGNGFLVYLLVSEGHKGVGIDLQRRDIWDQYPEKVRASLRHEEMDPLTYDCSEYDWILGNHSDELSPWIPVMAARCQAEKGARTVCDTVGETLADGRSDRELRRAYPRFFVLPCCFFDFDGRKVAFGKTRRTLGVYAVPGTGKYEQYYRWIAQITRAFGFTVEYENLRIPSTKYVSILGRFVEFEERIAPRAIKEMSSLLLLDAKQSHM